MPRGPKGERHPADAIGNAIMIAKIADVNNAPAVRGPYKKREPVQISN